MSHPVQTAGPTAAELEAKNRIYDHADDAVWRLAVYEGAHNGAPFTNIGGAAALDAIAARSGLGPDARVLDLGCGSGEPAVYLAESFRFSVTGVDVNRKQLERARTRAQACSRGVAARLNFVEADLRLWEPAERFDAAYSLDSLMLVPRLDLVLGRLRGCLSPGAYAILTELTAGPQASQDLLAKIWEIDGMISVLPTGSYQALLEQSGFGRVELVDLTDLAVGCFGKIDAALQEKADPIIQEVGDRSHRAWVDLTRFYLECFRNRSLEYWQVVAQAR